MWQIDSFICDVYMAHKRVVYGRVSRAITLKTVLYVQIIVRMRGPYNSQTNIYSTKKK